MITQDFEEYLSFREFCNILLKVNTYKTILEILKLSKPLFLNILAKLNIQVIFQRQYRYLEIKKELREKILLFAKNENIRLGTPRYPTHLIMDNLKVNFLENEVPEFFNEPVKNFFIKPDLSFENIFFQMKQLLLIHPNPEKVLLSRKLRINLTELAPVLSQFALKHYLNCDEKIEPINFIFLKILVIHFNNTEQMLFQKIIQIEPDENISLESDELLEEDKPKLKISFITNINTFQHALLFCTTLKQVAKFFKINIKTLQGILIKCGVDITKEYNEIVQDFNAILHTKENMDFNLNTVSDLFINPEISIEKLMLNIAITNSKLKTAVCTKIDLFTMDNMLHQYRLLSKPDKILNYTDAKQELLKELNSDTDLETQINFFIQNRLFCLQKESLVALNDHKRKKDISCSPSKKANKNLFWYNEAQQSQCPIENQLQSPIEDQSHNTIEKPLSIKDTAAENIEFENDFTDILSYLAYKMPIEPIESIDNSSNISFNTTNTASFRFFRNLDLECDFDLEYKPLNSEEYSF